MANDSIKVLFPVGRLVQGNLYKAQTTDQNGQPLVVKNGPNKGQPRVNYFFAVAIKKEPGHTHWSHTDWGLQIWNFGHKVWPGGQTQRPDFAWKIEDGDSTIPNQKMKKPCDQEGFPGHWIIRSSSSYAPKIWDSKGTTPIVEEGIVKPGHFIQLFADVASNNNEQKCGIYINHNLVAYAGYGPEITFGPDAAEVGFGQGAAGALPAGASSVPLGAMTPPATGAAPLPPGAPSVPIASPPASGAVATPPPVPAAAPSTAAVVPQPTPPPSTTFTANAAGAPPPPTPVQPQRVMLPAAGGVPYEQFIASGWTDDLLIQHGKMQAA